MEWIRALWVDSLLTVDRCDQRGESESCPKCLQMSSKAESRISRTPARYHQMRATFEVRWRTEFYEAADLIEVSRRFGQDGMTVATFREKTVLNVTNEKLSAVLNAQSLHLPQHFDLGRLQLQLQVLTDRLLLTRQYMRLPQVSQNVILKPALTGGAEKLIKVCMCPPISVFSALKHLKTRLRSSMSQKKLTP